MLGKDLIATEDAENPTEVQPQRKRSKQKAAALVKHPRGALVDVVGSSVEVAPVWNPISS